MTSRTYYDLGDSRFSGAKCTSCNTTYYSCTKNLVSVMDDGKSSPPEHGHCCADCATGDTHNTHKVGLLSPGSVMKDKTKVEIAGISSTVIQDLMASLEAARDNVTGYAEMLGAALTLKVDDVVIDAVWDGSDWRVRFRESD